MASAENLSWLNWYENLAQLYCTMLQTWAKMLPKDSKVFCLVPSLTTNGIQEERETYDRITNTFIIFTSISICLQTNNRLTWVRDLFKNGVYG